MFEYSSSRDVTKYLLWDAHPDITYTRDYLAYLGDRYALGDFYDWALVLKENGKMIGTCGFTNIDLPNNSAEIGYVLNPSFRGRGLAPEAAEAVIRFGFERMALTRISAICMKDNVASLRVMHKCGMSLEGTLRSALYVKGQHTDICVSAILANSFI